MCGIAGIVGAGSRDAGLTLARRMAGTLVHRGPDDDGSWADDRVAVAMRRLSVIDIAGGHQPMVSDAGTVVVFNGEIYNYKELRASLAADGVAFATRSDTEVVLKLADVAPNEVASRLRGMFAFCAYRPADDTLWLYRDRLGIKPLYYAVDDGRLVFGSELKAILEAFPTRPPLDQQALYDYLTLRYVPAPATPWAGVRKVPPGHALRYDVRTGAVSVAPYWSSAIVAEHPDPTRDYGAEFEKLFLDAVETHLVAADVPVGVLLSGGLDSSSVSAAAVELGHRAFHTFSVGFAEGDAYDELPHARAVAERIGSQHHEVVLSRSEFVDLLPALVRYGDEPVADLAAIPLHVVSRLAREHVTVVLSGEGSDEILAGYQMEQTFGSLERLRRVDRWLPGALRPALTRVPGGGAATAVRALAEGGWSGYLRARTSHMTAVWPDVDKRALWGGRGAGELRSTDTLIRSWYDEAPSPHPFDQLQQVACASWLADDLLAKADRMTMATSLELRVPFLDHPLVEWAARLPFEQKVGPPGALVSKRILRQFARTRLPASVIDRPKQGFPVPAYGWLAGPLAGWARDKVLDRTSSLADLVDVSAAQPAVDAATAGNVEAAHQVWALVILRAWLDQWL